MTDLAELARAGTAELVADLREVADLWENSVEVIVGGAAVLLLRQAATALEAASTGGGWRDIESAPKDGKFILLYLYDIDGAATPVQTEGCWMGERWWWPGCYYDLNTYRPSHWQFLQAPPTPPSGVLAP